jgi:predicted nuclease of predicted toxin-antitoxin system
MAYGLTELGHNVFKLRHLIDPETKDEDVLSYAAQNGYVLVTCNRDDFLKAAQEISHAGLIILKRRNTRVRERVALLRLLDKAGDEGIRHNINFA